MTGGFLAAYLPATRSSGRRTRSQNPSGITHPRPNVKRGERTIPQENQEFVRARVCRPPTSNALDSARQEIQLFLSGVIRRRCRLGWSWSHVHVLSGLGVTELLARFFLDGLVVRLQLLNLACVALIFLLLFENLLVQRLILEALLLVDDHPVGAEYDVREQRDRGHHHKNRGQPPPQHVDAHEQWTHPPDPGRSQCLGSRCVLHHGAQAVFGTRNSWQISHSKIHCFAAAPSCSRSRSLRASEYARTTGSVPDNR